MNPKNPTLRKKLVDHAQEHKEAKENDSVPPPPLQEDLKNGDFSDLNLDGIMFSPYEHDSLAGASFKNSSLRKGQLSVKDFTNVNFDGADLTGTAFDLPVDLTGASFKGTNLNGVYPNETWMAETNVIVLGLTKSKRISMVAQFDTDGKFRIKKLNFSE